MAHLARLHQLVQRAQRLLLRRLRIGPVGLIQVDIVGLEPAQRRLHRCLGPGRRQVVVALPHVRSDLGQDLDVVALAARLQPLADDRLAFAAGVARNPARIGVGGVDGVKAGLDEGVQQGE